VAVTLRAPPWVLDLASSSDDPLALDQLMSWLHRELDRLLPTGQATWIGVVARRLGLLVLALLLLAGTRRYPILLAIVAVAFVLASLYIDRKWPIANVLAGPHPLRTVGIAVVVMVLGGVIAVAQWGSGGGAGFALVTSIATFVGLAALFLGAGAVTAWLRSLRSIWLAAGVSTVVVVLVLVGVHGLRANSSVQIVLGGAGLLLAPVAVALFGELLIGRFDGKPPDLNAALFGFIALGVLVVSAAVMLLTGTVPAVTVVLVLVGLLVLVFLITARPNLDTVIVVVVLAISWATVPRAVSVSHSPELVVADGDSAFAAIGDSYMSGEGAKEFYDGTNAKDSNECRRAPTAYSVLLAHDAAAHAHGVPARVIFLACSGAVVDDFYVQPQFRDDPIGGPSELQANGVYEPGQTQLEQLARRVARSQPQLAFALVSVGGNDAHFGSIVKTCIAPGDCSVFAPRWNALVDALPATLDRAYRRVGESIPKGRVIVVPYPIPVSDRADCPSSTFTQDERRFLVEFTNRLDDVITKEAHRHGFLVADTRNAMTDANARLCDTGRRGINGVSLNPQEGELSQVANPTSWLHDSMHPNEYGHGVIEEALAKWLTEPATEQALAAMKRYHDPGPPPAAGPPPACDSCPSYCTADLENTSSCESRWTRAEIGGVVSSLSMLLLLIWLAASWLLACVIIGRWRAEEGRPAPAASVP
jgi:lysophospholipase L1-like esterase